MILLFFWTCSASAAIPIASTDTAHIISEIEKAVETRDTDPATIKSLIHGMNMEENPIRVREYSAWALGQLEARSAAPDLIKAAKHKGLLIRAAALTALMHMRARSALPVYIDMAKHDPVLLLRQRAIIAMGLLRWEKTTAALVDLSEDSRSEIRGAAALAMGVTHTKTLDFSDILKEMRQDEDPYVRIRALKALRITERRHDTIQTHLQDEDADVRLMAALYFHYNGNKLDIQALKNQLEVEEEPEVRYELEQALLGVDKRLKKQAQSKESQP